MTLTDEIYRELRDGLERGLEWQQFLAKYSASKGPLYNALGRVITDVAVEFTSLGQKREKFREEVAQTELRLDQLKQTIEEVETTIEVKTHDLSAVEEVKGSLEKEIGSLESKADEKGEFIAQIGGLEKLGFDSERLRQLREALVEIGVKHGLRGKQAVTRFFDDLRDYGAVLEAELQLKGLQTQIETKKLEAENWQAKEEALRRKHNELKEAIGAVHALRTRGIKVSQIVTWHRILSKFEPVEQFEQSLAQYADVVELLSAREEETKSYELKRTKAQSEVQTLEKERVKIEGAIDALKVAGVKEVEAIAEAVEKQLKAVAAKEIRETQAVGHEVRSEFSNYFTQVDQLIENVFQIGQKYEGLKKQLQKYEGVKDVLDSHAVASGAAK